MKPEYTRTLAKPALVRSRATGKLCLVRAGTVLNSRYFRWETLVESDDLDLLHAMLELAEGPE